MANTKISAFPSVTVAGSADTTTLIQSGANANITVGNLFASPSPIGATTPSTGAFSNITLPKTSATGIKVDTAVPTWGWRDITATVQPKATGAGSPN